MEPYHRTLRRDAPPAATLAVSALVGAPALLTASHKVEKGDHADDHRTC
jgi:hypothetical protein